MSEPLRAVLFDLDGTLLDTLEDIGNAMNFALTELGYATHSLDRYRAFIGRGMEQLVREALPAEARGQAEALVARFRARYRERLIVTSRPYPGIPELLDALSARSMPIAILSNKPDVPTRLLVEALLGRWPFREVRGERVGVPRKPAPDAALDIARSLGMPSSACVFVGDSAVDMETARAAGMRRVGVLWGFRGRSELEEAGAESLLTRPEDLLPILAAGLRR